MNATPGALSGEMEGGGEMVVEVDEEDPALVSMRVVVPYGLLRHLMDPWDSDLPGTFFEPIHLHMESEFVPVWAEDRILRIEREVNEPVESGDEEVGDG